MQEMPGGPGAGPEAEPMPSDPEGRTREQEPTTRMSEDEIAEAIKLFSDSGSKERAIAFKIREEAIMTTNSNEKEAKNAQADEHDQLAREKFEQVIDGYQDLKSRAQQAVDSLIKMPPISTTTIYRAQRPGEEAERNQIPEWSPEGLVTLGLLQSHTRGEPRQRDMKNGTHRTEQPTDIGETVGGRGLNLIIDTKKNGQIIGGYLVRR